MTERHPTAFRLLTLACIAITLQACAPTGGLDSSRDMDPQTVMTRVEGRSAGLSGFTGYGRLSMDMPAQSGSASIAVRAIKPDSLMLEITGPFGVTVARALVTQKDFRFYDGLENTVLEGASTAANLRRVLRMEIEFRDIIDLVTGSMTFRQRPEGSEPEGAFEDSDYHILFAGEDETCEYWVDNEHLAVRRFLRRNEEGAITEEVTFREFREKDGVHVPQVISISRPLREESLVLVYERMSVNDFPIEMHLTVPASARRITL